jgi:hypothetical protein
MNIPLKQFFKFGLLVGLLIGLIILNKILPGKGDISIIIGAGLIIVFLVYEWNKVVSKKSDKWTRD